MTTSNHSSHNITTEEEEKIEVRCFEEINFTHFSPLLVDKGSIKQDWRTQMGLIFEESQLINQRQLSLAQPMQRQNSSKPSYLKGYSMTDYLAEIAKKLSGAPMPCLNPYFSENPKFHKTYSSLVGIPFKWVLNKEQIMAPPEVEQANLQNSSNQRQELADSALPSYNSVLMQNKSFKKCFKRGMNKAAVVNDALSGQSHVAPELYFPDHYDPSFFVKTSKKPKTIVFDLDETLVHVTTTGVAPEHYDVEARIKINQDSAVINTLFVAFRPHLTEVLKELQKHYELILFTAATEQYAHVVIDLFDLDDNFFDHILHRGCCILDKTHKVYVKDLSLLSEGRDLKDIIIVDNKVESYAAQLENGIPIKDFFGNPQDGYLLLLKDYLLGLKEANDVRPVIKEHFIKNK